MNYRQLLINKIPCAHCRAILEEAPGNNPYDETVYFAAAQMANTTNQEELHAVAEAISWMADWLMAQGAVHLHEKEVH